MDISALTSQEPIWIAKRILVELDQLPSKPMLAFDKIKDVPTQAISRLNILDVKSIILFALQWVSSSHC